MPRNLLALNVLFVAAALAAGSYVVSELRGGTAEPVARTRPVVARAAPAAGPPEAAERPAAPAGGYGVVASRNLFSPTRSEATAAAVASGPAAPVVRPMLYGVVLRDGAPLAYLEDPVTKRVAGYRLGDRIAGGAVQAIAADHVVIARPEGNVDVRLRDPSKPRPPAPGQAGTPAGQPVTAGTPRPAPGAIRPPGVGRTGEALRPVPGRRPLPPSLLRRVPPGAPSDGTPTASP